MNAWVCLAETLERGFCNAGGQACQPSSTRALALEPEKWQRQKTRGTGMGRREDPPSMFTPGEKRMPTVCQAAHDPRKLKLSLGSSGSKGGAAPSRCRIWEMQLPVQRRGATLTCQGEMQLSAGGMQLQLGCLPLPMRDATLRRSQNSGSGLLIFSVPCK